MGIGQTVNFSSWNFDEHYFSMAFKNPLIVCIDDGFLMTII